MLDYECEEESHILDTSIGASADPSLWAVSPQVTSHKPSGRLPLLSARPAVTIPADEYHSLKCFRNVLASFALCK